MMRLVNTYRAYLNKVMLPFNCLMSPLGPVLL